MAKGVGKEERVAEMLEERVAETVEETIEERGNAARPLLGSLSLARCPHQMPRTVLLSASPPQRWSPECHAKSR